MFKFYKKQYFTSALIFVLSVSLFGGMGLVNAKSGVVANGDGGRKIVVWKNGVSDLKKDNSIKASGAEKVKDLKIVNASAISVLNKSVEDALLSNPNVLRVDEDVTVAALGADLSLLGKGGHGGGKLGFGRGGGSSQPPQVLPWGVDRIDAELVWPSGNNADPVKVGVIDTGISSSHPDLKYNIKGGYNAINPRKSWSDDNGHGSHVAGIIAAGNNSIGVVGGAPLVDLYAIKVLGANGSGFLSDVIEGLDWAVANHIQVVNMSLGSSSDVQSFHDAVTAAYNAGVMVVAAAGNSGGAVIYPAAYSEAVAVSATDSNNQIASFSSRGPEVALSAPGVDILSTYKGSGYATLSGTSMAAPHVAASAALVVNTPVGSYDFNANGKWDPSEVLQKLENTATDLGVSGRDNLYGYGLVNAFQAVQ